MTGWLVLLGVGAVVGVGYGLYRLAFRQQLAVQALLAEDGVDASLLGFTGSALPMTRTRMGGRIDRAGLSFTYGTFEQYAEIPQQNGPPKTVVISEHAYVALDAPGPRPYRLANLTPGSGPWRLARALLVPVEEITDTRLLALVQDAQDVARGRSRAIDDLRVLVHTLTTGEAELLDWLGAPAGPASAARARALLTHLRDIPTAQRVAARLAECDDPELRGLAGLTLATPEALWRVATDGRIPEALRQQALRAWPPGWAADEAQTLLAWLAADAPLAERAAEKLTEHPEAGTLALAALDGGRVSATLLGWLGRVGAPEALPALGALIHRGLLTELDGPAREALARLQARHGAAAAGGLAVVRARAGALAEATPPARDAEVAPE